MKKGVMEKAAKGVDTIDIFAENEQKTPQSAGKKTKVKYDIHLSTYITRDDMVKFNNIISAKSRNQVRILKPADVLRNLIVEYIKANEDLA
jgi:hypothetical protein